MQEEAEMRPIFLPYVSIADMLTQTFGSDC